MYHQLTDDDRLIMYDTVWLLYDIV